MGGSIPPCSTSLARVGSSSELEARACGRTTEQAQPRTGPQRCVLGGALVVLDSSLGALTCHPSSVVEHPPCKRGVKGSTPLDGSASSNARVVEAPNPGALGWLPSRSAMRKSTGAQVECSGPKRFRQGSQGSSACLRGLVPQRLIRAITSANIPAINALSLGSDARPVASRKASVGVQLSLS